jgi:type II secretory pathway component GspD/PulD (secretin)
VEQVSATPQALRAAVTELAEGITVTADPGTNSLVIQASQEGFRTLAQVIEQLDIPRPQVLVEALIMQVNVTDSQELGFNGIARIVRGDTDYAFGSLTGADARPRFTPRTGTETTPTPTTPPSVGDIADTAISSLIAAASKNTLRDTDGDGVIDRGTLITGIITAAAQDNDTEILSAPHILTTDNEEAEIKVGANIPIITSRVQSAQGITQATSDLATSVNVERQDIGVTLRVTPQISEGDNVRLEIFQEITDIDEGLSVGDPNEVGVPLSNRKVENTVVVADGETVVIGGLISDDYSDTVTKVPWLGDIPFLGWLFKSTDQRLTKQNLLIFLTPHIVREAPELASQTIRKREEFRARSTDVADLSGADREREEERRELAEAAGLESPPDPHEPVRSSLERHERRYPLERMREIEAGRREREARSAEEAARAASGPRYAVLAAVFRDERAATETLTQLLDAGYEGTLVSGESQGTLLFEVRLGPFASLEEAEQAASVARQSFGLAPTVLVERDEP